MIVFKNQDCAYGEDGTSRTRYMLSCRSDASSFLPYHGRCVTDSPLWPFPAKFSDISIMPLGFGQLQLPLLPDLLHTLHTQSESSWP